jgi:hypothetical protein
VLLRRSGPVPGILAARRPGRLCISLNPNPNLSIPPFCNLCLGHECYPCLGHTVTYVLAMSVTYVLAPHQSGSPPGLANPLGDEDGDEYEDD